MSNKEVLSVFTDDVEMMSDMLVGLINTEKQIEQEIYNIIASEIYSETGEIAPYFRQKVAELRLGKELKCVNRAIATLSLEIGKHRKMINTENWDWKLERAKKSDILRVVQHYLGDSGVRLRFKCPFHGGKNRNMQVYPDKSFYNCYKCGASGDTIKFVIEYEKCEFREAIEILQNF